MRTHARLRAVVRVRAPTAAAVAAAALNLLSAKQKS